MKLLLGYSFLFFSTLSFANKKDSTIYYSLPDSVKAISFMAEISVTGEGLKSCKAGIKTDAVTLLLEKHNNGGSVILFYSNASPAITMVKGLHVGWELKYGYPQFAYAWKKNEPYKLLIAQATDSAGNYSLYSGYIFLPNENKWKLIGTLKINGRWNTIQKPAAFYTSRKRQAISISTSQVWCQRQNGSWKNLLQTTLPSPIVNLFSHVDSLEQIQIDKNLITKSVSGTIQERDGIYYTIIKEGTGKRVSVDDTVTAFYKGTLLDGSLFDETKDKPATFPLNRLIRGWQIGVPLCKVGGKIRIIIPSNFAYSIRTRSAKIPPNSILVFEIEITDARSLQ